MKVSKKTTFRFIVIFVLIFTFIISIHLLYYITSFKENLEESNDKPLNYWLSSSLVNPQNNPPAPAPAPAQVSNSDRIAALENKFKNYPKL
jgi:flagellar basal body-associated protein FliL